MKREHIYYVYILSNKWNNVLYTGMTNNLVKRVHQHKNKLVKGFSSRYNVDKLVYFETYQYVSQTITRETQLKSYNKSKKEKLINQFNPEWKDLWQNGKIVEPPSVPKA